MNTVISATEHHRHELIERTCAACEAVTPDADVYLTGYHGFGGRWNYEWTCPQCDAWHEPEEVDWDGP